jgi:hypothetical protein
MDKIKSLFSGGSNAAADDHAGHDHSGHDHSHEPAADMAATPMSEPGSDDGEDTPA